MDGMFAGAYHSSHSLSVGWLTAVISCSKFANTKAFTDGIIGVANDGRTGAPPTWATPQAIGSYERLLVGETLQKLMMMSA